MDRAKEEDSYERKRQELERELTERRSALAREEEETAALRERAKRFDAELSEAIAKARMEAENRVRGDETAKAALLAEQVKRETGIMEYRAESLAKENESLRSDLASLKEELRKAYDASKEVAVKVIEGVAGERSLRDVSRIAMEQARGAGKREE